jgi:hypothetical protein
VSKVNVSKPSKVRKFKIKSRLASLAFQPGGVSANQALKQADSALDSLRGPALAALDASIAEIDARYGPHAAGRADEPFEDLYRLSSSIIDMALFLPGSSLDNAARCFCGLVDLSHELDIRAWDAIDVHIEALKLLRIAGASMSGPQRQSILDGLGQVTRKRVGDPSEYSERLAAAG